MQFIEPNNRDYDVVVFKEIYIDIDKIKYS